jgi:hypothetical protein
VFSKVGFFRAASASEGIGLLQIRLPGTVLATCGGADKIALTPIESVQASGVGTERTISVSVSGSFFSLLQARWDRQGPIANGVKHKN